VTENGNGNGNGHRLTSKQQVWLVKYFQCWNGAEAARCAGYARPRHSAAENLAKPYIQDAIKAHLLTAGLTPELVLSELLEEVKFDLGSLVGKGGVIDWEDAKTKGLTRHLKSISWSKGGIRVEAYSKQRALELVGKHLGLFVERHEHTGAEGGPIETRITEVVVEIPGEEVVERDVFPSVAD
jgi:phage terminase small subunit